MYFIYRSFAFFSLSCLISAAWCVPETTAQECETAVSRAEHSYELGDFHEVLATLAPCLPNSLPTDDIWRGYRLRAISYLLLDEPDSADEAIGYLLRYNPGYRGIPDVDPYEFVHALARYTDYAQFSFGVFLDGFASKVELLQANTLTQSVATSSDYETPIKVNPSLEALYAFNPSISAGLDVAILNENIIRNLQAIRGLSSQYTENNSTVAVPLFARYRMDSARILGMELQPFFEAGIYGQWTTQFEAQIVLTNSDGTATTLSDPNPGDRRKSFNYGWMASAGLVIPLQGSEILLRGRYWNGLADLTRPAARYTSSLFLPGYYEDDDIALRGFEISVGINLLFGYREYKLDKQ